MSDTDNYHPHVPGALAFDLLLASSDGGVDRRRVAAPAALQHLQSHELMDDTRGYEAGVATITEIGLTVVPDERLGPEKAIPGQIDVQMA
jgi:hypothetical protein